MELRLHVWALSLAITVFGSACGEGVIGDLDDTGSPRGAFNAGDSGVDPSEPTGDSGVDPSEPTDGEPPRVTGGQCSLVDLDAIPPCDEASYYVDAGQGSDSNRGTSAEPWATLGHARSSAPSGATICVRDGDYGGYGETSPPAIAQRHVVRAQPGHTPTFSSIFINYASPANSQLTLSGLKVYGSANIMVQVSNAHGARLNQLDVSGTKWASGGIGREGIRVQYSNDVIVDSTKIHEMYRCMQVRAANDIKIYNNYLRCTAGSGIQYISGPGGDIAYNHIRGVDYNPSDPDSPPDPHASVISFRGDNIQLRNNHLHAMGSSSGIMFYQPDVVGGEASYDNILIENNAIYDITNPNALRFFNLGTNVVVRNNLFFPGIRQNSTCAPWNTTNDVRYRYDVGIVVQNVATGDGMSVYNNISVATFGPTIANGGASSRNNYVWSYTAWACSAGTNHIAVCAYLGCGNHPPEFEDGSFFSSTINPIFPGRDPYDLTLAPKSAGINFGDPNHQPISSLGSIGSDGFVVDDGPCRDASHHDVGPFQTP